MVKVCRLKKRVKKINDLLTNYPKLFYTCQTTLHMARSSEPTKTARFVIESRNLQLKLDLVNIAENKGYTLSTFLRRELFKIRDSYPEHMRKPPMKD